MITPDSSEKQLDNDDKLSKTQRKVAMIALQKIGEKLVELNDKQLEELKLPEKLFDAVKDAQRISKFGARHRQMQYIGKLMRNIDVLPIQEKLNAWQQIKHHQTAQLHQSEHWRERILTDANALTEFADKFPAADIRQIRLLARNTIKERKADKTPKNYRLLFRALHTAINEASEVD